MALEFEIESLGRECTSQLALSQRLPYALMNVNGGQHHSDEQTSAFLLGFCNGGTASHSYGASLKTSINAKFHQMELVKEQALANTESRLGGTVAFF